MPNDRIEWESEYWVQLLSAAKFSYIPGIVTEHLKEMDDEGWSLVQIFPVLGEITVIHRRYVPKESEVDHEANALIVEGRNDLDRAAD